MNATTAPASSSPAIAKARLLLDALNHASTRGLSPTAHAVLAHLIADAWPEDDGWTAHTSQASLASRLDVHVGTIARAIRELADIIDYRPGRGTRRSRYVISQPRAGAGTIPAPAQGPSPRQRRDLPAPALTPTQRRRGDIPVPGSSQHSSSTDAAAAAAADDDEPTPEQIAAHVARRPEWVPSHQAWLDADACAEIARLRPTWQRWCEVIDAARRSRMTLRSCAAFVIARLRAQPGERP